MTDRLITVPADQMSSEDFVRLLQGKAPLTAAEKAERKAHNERWLRIRGEEIAKYRAMRDAGPAEGESTFDFTRRCWKAIDAVDKIAKDRLAAEERDGLAVKALGNGVHRVAA